MKIYKGQMLYYYNKNSHMCESVAVILVCPDKQSFAVRWEGDVVWRPFDSIGKTLFLNPNECYKHYGLTPPKVSSRSKRGDVTPIPPPTTLGAWRNQDAWGRTKEETH